MRVISVKEVTMYVSDFDGKRFNTKESCESHERWYEEQKKKMDSEQFIHSDILMDSLKKVKDFCGSRDVCNFECPFYSIEDGICRLNDCELPSQWKI